MFTQDHMQTDPMFYIYDKKGLANIMEEGENSAIIFSFCNNFFYPWNRIKIPGLIILNREDFDNMVGKGENTGNQHFHDVFKRLFL